MATFSIGSEFLLSVLIKQSLERKQGWGKKEVKKREEEIEWGGGPLAGGRQLTLALEIVLRFNWK